MERTECKPFEAQLDILKFAAGALQDCNGFGAKGRERIRVNDTWRRFYGRVDVGADRVFVCGKARNRRA